MRVGQRCVGGWLLCCLLVLCSAPAVANQGWPRPVSTAPQAAPPGANLPFYEARKGALTIFLLGTLHVGKPTDYPFRPVVVDALRGASKVAFELSPDDVVMSQDAVQRYGMCSHACLPHLLPAPLWRKIVRRLRGNPAMLREIEHMRPWLAALLLDTLNSMSADLQTEYGTENQLENLYPGRILGLETIDEQMSAFTGLSRAEQDEMVAEELALPPSAGIEQLHELHRLWRAGDAEMIYDWSQSEARQVRQSPRLAREIDERILYARNRRFVTRLLFIADPNKPVFVAIGALHLGGPRGVLSLLRGQGFIVSQR